MRCIEKPTMHDVYFNHVHPLAVYLSKAQERGVLTDVDLKKRLIDEFDKKNKETLAQINELCTKISGKSFELNPNSSKQVQNLLYDIMRFPVIYNEEGRPTADENALLSLYKKYPEEKILSLILQYRKDTKLVSTFLEVEADENGCVHTSYNASGTKTYRISSSKDIWGGGMNLQNIPTGKRPGVTNLRNLFIARPGCKFVKADLAQAETMVVSRILCRYGDYTLWDKYSSGKPFDIHKWAASTIYGVDESEVDDTMRQVGKIANHSGNYCSGPRVIQATALKWNVDVIDYQTAKKIIETRRQSLPGLEKWWRDVERQLQKTRTLYTCLGRRRIFFGRQNDNTVLRDAVAFEPQSTVGDVCNIMFRRIASNLPSGSYCLLQVHDEVVVECLDEHLSDTIKIVKEASIVPLWLNKDLEPLIIPVEISVGSNWADMQNVL